jgi:hypothetical protein
MSHTPAWQEWRNEVASFLVHALFLQTALILRAERLLSETNVFTRWTRRDIGREGFRMQLVNQLRWWAPRLEDIFFDSDNDEVPEDLLARPVGPWTLTQHLIYGQPCGDYEDLPRARRLCYADLMLRSRRLVLLTRICDAQIAATIDEFLPWTEEWMVLVLAPALHRTTRVTCNICLDDFEEPADAILHASTHISCFPHGSGYPCCDCC